MHFSPDKGALLIGLSGPAPIATTTGLDLLTEAAAIAGMSEREDSPEKMCSEPAPATPPAPKKHPRKSAVPKKKIEHREMAFSIDNIKKEPVPMVKARKQQSICIVISDDEEDCDPNDNSQLFFGGPLLRSGSDSESSGSKGSRGSLKPCLSTTTTTTTTTVLGRFSPRGSPSSPGKKFRSQHPPNSKFAHLPPVESIDPSKIVYTPPKSSPEPPNSDSDSSSDSESDCDRSCSDSESEPEAQEATAAAAPPQRQQHKQAPRQPSPRSEATARPEQVSETSVSITVSKKKVKATQEGAEKLRNVLKGPGVLYADQMMKSKRGRVKTRDVERIFRKTRRALEYKSLPFPRPPIQNVLDRAMQHCRELDVQNKMITMSYTRTFVVKSAVEHARSDLARIPNLSISSPVTMEHTYPWSYSPKVVESVSELCHGTAKELWTANFTHRHKFCPRGSDIRHMWIHAATPLDYLAALKVCLALVQTFPKEVCVRTATVDYGCNPLPIYNTASNRYVSCQFDPEEVSTSGHTETVEECPVTGPSVQDMRPRSSSSGSNRGPCSSPTAASSSTNLPPRS